ncbi:MAG TPA: hypothetical protein VGX21_16965 [Methylomirabilota bacterium]|jgi:hypothetical protein|nr:hypothetical protein [Methylomirabilota bacterium]
MVERPCANPGCFCHTSDVTCSLWCGALDRPAGVRCLCRHDHCARPLARTPLWSAQLPARPTVRDTLERRPPLAETA